MSEEKIASIMRDFVQAVEKKDIAKALSFLAEDAVYVTPEGTFKGKEELKRYLTWLAQLNPEMTIRDAGIGIMVKANKAVFEHLIEGTYEGMKYQVPTVCIYEFSDDKIQNLRTVQDRLSITKQVARGWLAKMVVKSIVKRAEKGLR